MKKFFASVIRQRVAIVLIVLFVLAFGVFATLQMPINLLPDINVPMVCVQIIYPGANANSVDSDVTRPVEEGLSSISGVTGVESYSYDNVSAVVLSFDYGTDTTEKKSDISAKLSAVELPDGVTTTVYDIDLNAEALAVLSVTSSEGDTEGARLKNALITAEEMAAKLRAIDGVESVEIKGGATLAYKLTPHRGLELIAPLLVQAFSYGALDIPLGNITANGDDILIRNNTDVTSIEDIEATPVELPSSIVTLMSGVKQILRYYEGATSEDLKDLAADLDDGVFQVLQSVDEMSADELDELAELKTYMNVGANFTAEQLKNFKSSSAYNELEKAVKNDDGTGKTDEELEDLVGELGDRYPLFSQYITVDMLKVVRDGKTDDIISFREELEAGEGYLQASENNEYYSPTNGDYLLLVRKVGLFIEEGEGGATVEKYTEEEILELIEFVRQTSATGLANIADKKREAEEKGENYVPTDGECALLFTGTELSREHPIIMSSTFIAFVRADSYEENMRKLTEMRARFGDETEELTAAQFFEVYSALDLNGVFGFTLSEEFISLILEKDLTDLNPNGALVVTVADVCGEVEEDDSYTSYVYYSDGAVKPVKGVTIEVYKSNGANSSAVVDKVKEIALNGTYSGGNSISVRLLDDQSEFISDSISNVLVSMLIGGALAVVVIFVFLKRVRTSAIIAVTMPLSVLAALICLYVLGVTLNMVSLGGLAVGIGMLVDNSIVVIESITKHREMDKTAFAAAVDGTAEVGGALFGSTLTTVCVFIPILFSGGLTGEIFTDLSWAVIFSLTFSLIVAVTVIPALYALFAGRDKELLHGGKLSPELNGAPTETAPEIPEPAAEAAEVKAEPKKRSFKMPKIMDGVAGFYGRVLPAVLNKKLITILVAIAVFGASVGLLFLTGTSFLPSIDKGQIEVNMTYGSGRSLEEVQCDASRFATVIADNIENVDYVSVSVGKNGLLALTDTGIITVQLTTNKNTYKVVEQIRELSRREEFKPVGTVAVKEIDGVVASLMSGASDTSVTVYGEDGETLKEIATEVEAKLRANGFESISNSATDPSSQLNVTFDRAKMAELGLDYQTVVLTLRIGIASYTACTVIFDNETYNLNVTFDENAVTCVEDLKAFVVGADGDGNAVRLSDIATFKEEFPEACIRRTNGMKMVTISADLPGVDTGTAGKKLKSLASEVLGCEKYSGFSLESSGITTYLNDAFGGLVVALIISFFLLYAVMAVQFNSPLKPVIVMASIPFSFTGGFIALVITGTTLNVVSFIGLIMLMGVVVNNAIVMIEKIKQLEGEGAEMKTAVVEACKTRLRPILMTTLTTVLALIPLAIGVGKGSELMQPLGIVVIGGLLIGTLVTLVLVPAVYCAIYQKRDKKAKKA